MSDRWRRVPGRPIGGAQRGEARRTAGGRRRFRLGGGAVWGIAAGLFLLAGGRRWRVGAPLCTGASPLTGNLEHRLLPPGPPATCWNGSAGPGCPGPHALRGAHLAGGRRRGGGDGRQRRRARGPDHRVSGGMVDKIVSQLVDVQFSFPFMALALSIAAVLGAGLDGDRDHAGDLLLGIVRRLVRGETGHAAAGVRGGRTRAGRPLGAHPVSPRAAQRRRPPPSPWRPQAGRLIVAESR